MESLFVYGTLHPDRAPVEIRSVVKQFVWVGTGTVTGRLLDLGDYPGLVLDSPPLQPVTGHIFAFPAELLPALDAYEGFDPEDRDASLFVRSRVAITLVDGRIESHWAYLFHGSASRF